MSTLPNTFEAVDEDAKCVRERPRESVREAILF